MNSERGQQKANAITPNDKGNTAEASVVRNFTAPRNQKQEGILSKGRKGKGFKPLQEAGEGNTPLIRGVTKDSLLTTGTEKNAVLTAHVDYLRVKCDLGSEGEVKELFTYLTELQEHWASDRDTPWSPGGGALWFQWKVQGMYGLRGGWSPPDAKNGHHRIMADLPGEFWERLAIEDQWRLIRGLKHHFGADCTRIDLAIDDPTFSQIPEKEMEEAYQQGCMMGIRKRTVVESQARYSARKEKTVYYGSRRSHKMIRVYVHEGDYLRLEAELKGRFAKAAFNTIATLERGKGIDMQKLMEALVMGKTQIIDEGKSPSMEVAMKEGNWGQKITQVIAALAVGIVDFRTKDKVKDKSKANFRDTKRMPFWQEFVDKIGGHLRIKVPQEGRTISKTLKWVERSVMPTLIALREGLNAIGFTAYFNESRKRNFVRLTTHHEFLIMALQERPELVRLVA